MKQVLDYYFSNEINKDEVILWMLVNTKEYYSKYKYIIDNYNENPQLLNEAIHYIQKYQLI